MRTKLSERQLFERSISEEDVFGACRALLELNGARVFRITERIPWGPKGRKSEAGIPDVHGWWPKKEPRYMDAEKRLYTYEPGVWGPVHFWIEMKRPFKAQFRPAQQRWIDQAKADGVISFFAWSVESMAEGFREYGIHLKGV